MLDEITNSRIITFGSNPWSAHSDPILGVINQYRKNEMRTSASPAIGEYFKILKFMKINRKIIDTRLIME